MVVAKKSVDQQIEELEAKLKQLKAKKTDQVLDRSSPGMDQLLTSLDVVTKENKCSVLDVLKSVSRMKRTGAKIEPPTKKKRETKSVEVEAKTSKVSRVGQVKKS